MKLVMLSGWRGSGKDTLADYMVANYGWKKLSFAGALKDHVAEVYGVDRALFDDRDRKDKPLFQFPVHRRDAFSAAVADLMAGEFAAHEGRLYHTPRSMCILEGSMKRSVDPDYWVRRALRGLDTGGRYVISDWRYRSEYESAAHLAPVTVRIERFTDCPSRDASECDLDGFAFQHVIQNRRAMAAFLSAAALKLSLGGE